MFTLSRILNIQTVQTFGSISELEQAIRPKPRRLKKEKIETSYTLVYATFPAHLTFRDFLNLIISFEEYKLLISS
jgi:hypothetical protein